MNSKADVQIRSILKMADQMIVISEKGFASSDDDGCLLLNGMVRECAYRLRDAAERERKSHGMEGDRDDTREGTDRRREDRRRVDDRPGQEGKETVKDVKGAAS